MIANYQFGDSYVGEYTESAMTGYGSYTFSDGTKITGYFENSVCNRHGKKVYPDGRIYIGEFENDVENGKGVYKVPTGPEGTMRTISGIWKNGELIQELVSKNMNKPNSAEINEAYKILQ